ncbi:hypothetical protein [Jeotgalibacillus aurantiacus]|uniref:hypothetical protein n=1 Tax=Jeotgalibacillus aurantiacus TaxID=2763266 RepID=UPI001D0A1C9C|nr:hypothetical protein [Jeotgalibacillus aurantiacus]
MQIKLLYESAVRGKMKALALMIDYVVNEKKTLSFKDHVGNLNRYMLPKHQVRMNKLLNEYKQQKQHDPEWPLYDLFKKDGEKSEVKKSQ